MNTLTNGHQSQEWRRGKIYSVEVKDFVTYDHVLYYPGPYLNIIVGPNGTGKSTLVAAIVLGLGGAPKVLSRSQNIEDYVKNGKQCAVIEIVLLKDSKSRSKFKRVFNLDGHNKYLVNNTECSLKKFLEAVAAFNIQITNLCQFLPQDRVQDFAKMNPQELLHNTQASVCSAECSEMFDKLKELRSQQKGDGSALIAQINKLNEHEGKIDGLKDQVDNIKLKSNLTNQLEICQKKRAWMEFEELFIKFKEIEADLEKGNDNKKRVEAELAPLSQQASQINRLKQVHQTNIKVESDKASTFSTALNKLDEKTCRCEEAIVKAEGDLQFAIRSHEESKKEMETALVKQRALVEDVKRAVQIAGCEKDKKTQLEAIKNERTVYDQNVRILNDENRKTLKRLNEEIQPRLRSVTGKITQMENSKNIRLDLLRQRFREVHQGVLWLRQNQSKFRGRVYEPMILELNVKEGYAKYFENVIATRDLASFFCENNDDMKKLFQCLRNEQKLNVDIHAVKAVRALEFSSPSISEISRFGFNHFLLELVDGPLALINLLCRRYQIHRIPLGTEHTLSVTDSIPPKYSLYFTPNHRFFSKKSKYSSEVSTLSREISGFNLLNVSINLEILESLKREREEATRQSDRYRNEQGRIEVEIKELEVKINDLDQRKGQIDADFYNVALNKRNLQRQMKVIEDLQANIIDLDQENEKFVKKCAEMIEALTTLQKQKLEAAKNFKSAAIATECHRKRQRIFLRSTAELENQILEAQEKLNQAIRYVNNIKTALDDAKEKCKKQQALASKMTDNKKPSDARNFPYKKQFDELPDTMDELVDHINEIQGQMECVRNFNPEVITEYEYLLSEVERLKGEIEAVRLNHNSLDSQMDAVFKKWSDIILKAVTEINQHFSNFMEMMGFAGEVQLICPNERDYADYGIAIRVKYRNDEQLQSLDRFVQSGGERAVAIAAYTLSLQHMSHVPFRCVDEINQGMDPTNERRIFDMLVKETSQPGKSQFFFVTPKLLMNLSYNEYMTVSIVFNGRFVQNASIFQTLDQPN